MRHFDAPEALDTRFYEVRTKSALNRVPKASRLPFPWTVNPYRGCTHACAYCFARPTHEYLDLNAGRDFEREIVVKVNVPEVLRAELARPSWKRRARRARDEHRPVPVGRGALQADARDLGGVAGLREPVLDPHEVAAAAARPGPAEGDRGGREVSACLSVPTLDEKAWRATEPHTPHPRARLEAVAELNRQGIPTGILIAPLMPGINDAPEQVARIVELATEAGATYIGGNTLFLRGSVRELFFEWLREHRPDLVPRYERCTRAGRTCSRPTGARSSSRRRRAVGARRRRARCRADRGAARRGAAGARAGAADEPRCAGARGRAGGRSRQERLF